MNIVITIKALIRRYRALVVGLLMLVTTGFGMAAATGIVSASAAVPVFKGGFQCGSGKNAVGVSINIGCEGKDCKSSNKDGCSALLDAVFAIIRFLSAGVGLVVIGSVIWAGVQYSMAADDPGTVGKAKERIRNSAYALLMYIFAYAILNYIIPGGFFK